MTRYAVGLGSNLGDRRQLLSSAVRELGHLGEVSSVSGLYESAPVGRPDQGHFLNAVVLLDSVLGPHDLLAELHVIETRLGRVRSLRWGPRTLDLDVITTDGPELHDETLQIPHPRSGERRFVLDPLNDVWPEAIVSGGVVAADAMASVSDQTCELIAPIWV
jgi:2-amino-4-hydroxy-6-hydroxymethyldihydropteridine diphosphokinase